MLFDRYTPMIEGRTVADAKTDRRSAVKYGACRLSQEALYLPDGSYLLRSDITDAESRMGAAHVAGCCAGGVPVPRVIVTDVNGRKHQMLLDTQSTAERLVKALLPGKAD